MWARSDRSRLRLEIPTYNPKVPSQENISTIAGSIQSFEVCLDVSKYLTIIFKV